MRRLVPVWLVVAAGVAAGVACGPTGGPAVAPAADRYPAYSDNDALLFNDTFAPEVFGLELGTPEVRTLADRAQAADSVQRVRVTTVSSQGDIAQPAYTLVLDAVPPPLAGPGDSGPITVEVVANSPSFSLLRGAEGTLIGKTFILMSKRYNEDGHITLHWRAEPDTDAVRTQVSKTRALHDLEPSNAPR